VFLCLDVDFQSCFFAFVVFFFGEGGSGAGVLSCSAVLLFWFCVFVLVFNPCSFLLMMFFLWGPLGVTCLWLGCLGFLLTFNQPTTPLMVYQALVLNFLKTFTPRILCHEVSICWGWFGFYVWVLVPLCSRLPRFLQSCLRCFSRDAQLLGMCKGNVPQVLGELE